MSLANMNIYSIIAIAIICISFIIALIIVIDRIRKAKIKNIEIDCGTEIQTKTIINLQSVAYIFKESMRVNRKINRVEFQERLKEQMSYVEDEMLEIKEEIIKAHRHVLQAKGITKSDSEGHVQIKILTEMVENMLRDMKDIAREKFKEIYDMFTIDENVNDEYAYIKSDYEKYMERIIEYIIQESRGNIRKRWIEHEEIFIGRRESWDIIYELLSRPKGKIGEIIREIFINAINVQLKCSKKIRKLESEIDELVVRVSKDATTYANSRNN